MSDVIELNEIDALLEYHQDWTRLLSVTPGGSFYRSPEWLRDYWTHFADCECTQTESSGGRLVS